MNLSFYFNLEKKKGKFFEQTAGSAAEPSGSTAEGGAAAGPPLSAPKGGLSNHLQEAFSPKMGELSLHFRAEVGSCCSFDVLVEIPLNLSESS